MIFFSDKNSSSKYYLIIKLHDQEIREKTDKIKTLAWLFDQKQLLLAKERKEKNLRETVVIHNDKTVSPFKKNDRLMCQSTHYLILDL